MVASVKRFAYVRSAEFTEDENGVREYRDYYIAETTERVGSIAAIRRRRPDLQRWQPHPEDRDALVRRFALQQRKHSLLWDITVDYSTAAGEEEDNPLDVAARIEMGETTQANPVARDTNGRWLVNTAGKPLEGVTEDFSFVTLNVTKNIGPWPAWLLQYRQAVNSDAIRIKGLTCAPRTLKVGSLTIGAEQLFGDDLVYAELRMNLIYNEDTWDRWFLNRGLEEVAFTIKPNLKNKGRKTVEYFHQGCVDRMFQPVSEPVFLDEDGCQHRVDAEGKRVSLKQRVDAALRGESIEMNIKVKHPLDPEDIIFLRKQLRKPMPFSVLPLR
ncbi:MAG TPA: hypothetical protein VNQ76_02860 [Planctomicrobium sp.]|nr:hypothetical protein [Planctomicrobium sp.]